MIPLQSTDEFAIDPSFLEEGPDLASIVPDGMKLKTLPKPTAMNATWKPELTYDLALGIDSIEDILLRHNKTEDELAVLSNSRLFKMEVANLRSELQTEGVTIKRKARTAFESYLGTLHGLITDIDTPAATKHAMIRTVGDVAGAWAPREKVEDMQQTAAVNIQINL